MAKISSILTFSVPTGMEQRMAQTKRSLFHDATHSEMILTLIRAGLEAATETDRAQRGGHETEKP